PETVANVSFRKSESFSSRAAAAAKQNIKPNNDNRTRYSDKELNEFRALIDEKLAAARNELKYLQDQINRKDDNGTDDTENKFANMEDGTMTQEREYLTQMASRQVQYIENLEKALVRIQNKTYGICRVTGKLIDKERLRIVPHATLSMEAKMMQK
ncbi:MAG: TraR/DksA family transcriptional regulator, partial [Bacteroidota bacterium]